MLIGKQFTEKLYSTGDEMLDNLLERAFCEGYELAQREFNSIDQKLLRRASDYKRAMTGTGRLLPGEASQINKGMSNLGYNADRDIKLGRTMNKGIFGKPGGIDQKINMRGANQINKGY